MIIAAAMFTAAADRVSGAIIFAQDEAQSLVTGEQMATADKVRQVQFNIVGGSISRVDGTATPLGPWYSGLSKHYFNYVLAASGSSNFTILIATGANRDNRTQEIPIVQVIEHPSLDFVLLRHASRVSGATLPVFGPIGRFDTVSFAGYGNRQLFNQTTFVNDGRPASFTMTVSNTNNPSNYFSTSLDTSPIPGGGLNFDSSSPGYSSSGALCLFLETGTSNSAFATGGSIPFIASGLASWIEQNTPLNSVTPPPPQVTLSVAQISCEIQITNLTPAREYRIMRSSTLSNWEETRRFTAASTTATYSEPLAPEGRRFYRLEWNE